MLCHFAPAKRIKVDNPKQKDFFPPSVGFSLSLSTLLLSMIIISREKKYGSWHLWRHSLSLQALLKGNIQAICWCAHKLKRDMHTQKSTFICKSLLKREGFQNAVKNTQIQFRIAETAKMLLVFANFPFEMLLRIYSFLNPYSQRG